MRDLASSLVERGFEVQSLRRAEAARVFARWCETFMGRVKDRSGKYRHLGYHWHAFSYGIVKSQAGKAAFDQYLSMPPAQVFVIPESWKHGAGVLCHGSQLPDLTDLADDTYVFPESLEWTMAFTHEQPGHGPYFTWRDWCGVVG